MKKWIIITVIIILLFVLLIFFSLRLMFHSLTDYQAPLDLGTSSYIELDLSYEFPERAPYSISLFSFKKKLSFNNLLKRISYAAGDSKVEGLVLRADGGGLNFAQVEELQSALKEFKATGKKCYLFFNYGTVKNLLFAPLADEIIMPPSGNIFLPGLSMTPIFFKGSMDKLGIKWKVIKRGAYKNALEMFTADTLSTASREVYNAILDQVYNKIVTDIATGREIAADSVEALIDNYGIFLPSEALELNLVDRLQYYTDFKHSLALKKGENFFSIFDYRDGNTDFGLRDKGIALIYALGEIHFGKSERGFLTPTARTIGSRTYLEAIRDAVEDDDIKAIVLRVDSPGGSAEASDIIWNELVQAQAEKPVVVSMGGVAASGGYYISMSADRIVASPTTFTGSIGVIFGMPNLQGLYNKLGVTQQTLKRGKNADMFSEYTEMTESQELLLSRQITDVYDQFVTKAAEGRDLEVDSLYKLAEGRVWTGEQAYNNGLVDTLGGLALAIDLARDLAGIDDQYGVKLIEFPKTRMSFDLGMTSRAGMQSWNEVVRILETCERYQEFEPLYLMPVQLSFE